MIDLKDTAKSLVADLIRGDRLDLGELREDIGERAFDAADNACIYYHWCEEIISRYESDPRADTDSCDADNFAMFKPSEYQKAMQAYAFYIARSIIEAEACELMDEIEEARDHLALALATVGPAPPSSDFRLSADCPHGWAAHDREDDHGACFWVSRQLDGCNAVAVPAAGVWLSYTWEG